MQVYNYRPDTGEFICATDARESPLEPGVFLIPANATEVAPPTSAAGVAYLFQNGGWQSVPDHRGETWYRADGSPSVIETLGDPAQSDLLQTEPPAPPPTQADYAAAIQARVDAVAQAKQYTDGATLAGYATDPNPAYAGDAASFITWRSAVWVYANAQLALVLSGQRAQPTIDQLVGELPAAPWPVLT